MDYEAQLRALYAAFNARDIDRVLAAMSVDVDWPNAWEGGRLRGHEAVRRYWTRQWAEVDPRVEPIAISSLPDGRVEVDVHQLARGLDGDVRSEGRVLHIYEFRDELVTRMEVEQPP